MIAALFAEVLGIDRLAPEDDFFERGGHSLRATQLIAQIRDVFQLELPLRSFLETPTVAGVALALTELAAGAGVPLDDVVAEIEGPSRGDRRSGHSGHLRSATGGGTMQPSEKWRTAQLWCDFATTGIARVAGQDPQLFDLIGREYLRQLDTLAMVAASSVADPSVLVCEGTALANITTEGYPGHRFHGGCEYVDAIEALAVKRAGGPSARYTNVQPHSGSSANQIVLFGVLRPGDRVLGLDLDSGGHLTHGAPGLDLRAVLKALTYGVDARGLLDYDQVRDARTAPPAPADHLRCQRISADHRLLEVPHHCRRGRGILLADISHIAGLVAAGCHPSPIAHAHVTTTSTYKQLYGPRGGLILSGPEADLRLPGMTRTLAETMQRAVFPTVQGTPNLGAVAAKGAAPWPRSSPTSSGPSRGPSSPTRALAGALEAAGWRVLTGGTDNHMVLLDVTPRGLTGVIAERAAGGVRHRRQQEPIPGDHYPAAVASGLRLGTNCLALRGMDELTMTACAGLLDRVLTATEPQGDVAFRDSIPRSPAACAEVQRLCRRYTPLNYPAAAALAAECEPTPTH